MLQTWLRRSSALLAAGAMLLSSAVALAAPGPAPDDFSPGDTLLSAPRWQAEMLPEDEPAPMEPAAEPDPAEPAAEPVRFLLRLPPEGGTPALIDEAGETWCFSGEEETRCVSVVPGEYTLVCGVRSAALRVEDDGGVAVLSGEAAWDGEQLTVGLYGTLELYCAVVPDCPRMVSLTAAGETHTLPAAYDPLLDDGRGCVVCHQLTLPAGTVELVCGGLSQRVALQPGQTLRVEF